MIYQKSPGIEALPQTIIYEVISTNLKVRDGEFVNELFFSKEAAYNRCLEYVKSKQGKDMQEDPNGELAMYLDTSLNYAPSSGSAAVYYTSYYGAYPMACFVRERQIN